MRIANQLGRDDARRITRALGMTDLSDTMTPFGAAAERRRYLNRKSDIAVDDATGRAVTRGLVHLRLEELEALPDDLRRKLLQCGHVYVRLDHVRAASMVAAEGDTHAGLFAFDSAVFGEPVGIGRYTVPEPGIERLGMSDMGERFSFHRVMPEMLANDDTHGVLQGMDSDLRLYVDLGAVEAAAFQQISHRAGGR